MSGRVRTLVVAVALLLGSLLVVPTEAQNRLWILVNGALRYVGPIQVGDGTASLPSYTFAAQSGLGFYRSGSSAIALANDGVSGGIPFAWSAGIFRLGSAGTIAWAGTTAATGSSDTAITRVAAGQFGWTAVLFANLGTPANGTFCYCSDCTIAATCGSGGAGALAKRLNGAWVCN